MEKQLWPEKQKLANSFILIFLQCDEVEPEETKRFRRAAANAVTTVQPSEKNSPPTKLNV